MRRNAAHLLIPGVLAVLAVMLIGGTRGTAEPSRASHRHGAPVAIPAPEAQPAAAELLVSATVTRTDVSAAKKPEPELLHDAGAPAQLKPQTLLMEVTAYCPCKKCCGPDAAGITASGRLVSHNGGQFVAADTTVLPFGTKLVIPGYAGEEAVEVIDRGGAIKGNKLDLYFDSHDEALEWGRQMLDVTIVAE